MSQFIVFDVDGTILDSFGMYERVLRVYSELNKLPYPDVDAIKRGYGEPEKHDFMWGVAREEQIKHLMDSFRLNDEWSLSGDPDKIPDLFSGVKDALVHLKDLGYTLGIVTSKPEGPLLYQMEHHGVARLFSGIRTGTDVKRRGEAEKPAPDQLLSLMRELGKHPQETLMVGDTSMDVRMGRNAAALTLGVTWGAHPVEELVEAGAHHIIDTHFDDVVAHVKTAFG
ncbi:MAG: HAD family hydrolase [Alphaproteobacteria bacterium]